MNRKKDDEVIIISKVRAINVKKWDNKKYRKTKSEEKGR